MTFIDEMGKALAEVYTETTINEIIDSGCTVKEFTDGYFEDSLGALDLKIYIHKTKDYVEFSTNDGADYDQDGYVQEKFKENLIKNLPLLEKDFGITHITGKNVAMEYEYEPDLSLFGIFKANGDPEDDDPNLWLMINYSDIQDQQQGTYSLNIPSSL